MSAVIKDNVPYCALLHSFASVSVGKPRDTVRILSILGFHVGVREPGVLFLFFNFIFNMQVSKCHDAAVAAAGWAQLNYEAWRIRM